MSYVQQDYARQPPGRVSGPRAGFWRRFAASLIDGILIGLAIGILSALLHGGGYAVGFIAGIAYYTYLEGGPRGQTLGKSAMNIRVISLDTAGPIGYGRAFVRYIGRIVSSIPLYLGYFWMLWDREHQTWHDKFAGAVVVPLSA